MTNRFTLLGAHMSIAGGFEKAIERGTAIGCTALQIFTKSNRQWHASPITPEASAAFLSVWKKSAVQKVVAHSSYLINFGSSDLSTQEKSRAALIIEMQRCQQLGIQELVLHPGSCSSGNTQLCIQHIQDNLNRVLDQTPSQTVVLLENMAGQGSSIGATFEQLQKIYAGIHQKERIGFCFDTCHAFAAGYGLATPEAYEHTFTLFDQILDLKNLRVIHVNDSKKPQGSRVDRHEHIGKGLVGIESFRFLMNDPRLLTIPKILETPKEEGSLEEDRENMALLRSLCI